MRNVQVTLTYFEHESRMLKEINSLLGSKLVSEVIVVALWKKGLKKKEIINDKIRVIRVDLYIVSLLYSLTLKLKRIPLFGKLVIELHEIRRNKLMMILVSLQVFRLRPHLVNIHHVEALGVVQLKRILRRCLFIYDTHELETETLYSVGDIKIHRQRLEQKFIPRVDYTFVVTPSIENWYRETYSIENITTIMNTPLKHGDVVKKDLFRNLYNLESKDTLFIYNGSLFDGRGIQILLEVFENLPDKSNHIVFMGRGELESLIIEYEGRNENIHFKEAVHPSEVIEYTAAADVGFSLIENACLSYYYCLPNKIFEYTIAEIPLIVSNMQDMSNYVVNNKLGLVVDGKSVDEISQSVEVMARDKDLYKAALMEAKEKFNWEAEEEKMIRVYKNLFNQ